MSDSKQANMLTTNDITMVKNAIHNPAEIRHFLRLKPANRQIQIVYKGQILAETNVALRLIEVGHDIYDPALYLPTTDIKAQLVVNENTSHCPLKGDAQYFNLVSEAGAIIEENIAWAYPEPFGFIGDLEGLISFYTDKVSVEEMPI